MTQVPMQNSNSTMCGSICINIAHLVFSTNSNGDAPDSVYANDTETFLDSNAFFN